ncbi:MAG: hypothetical protein PHU43_11590 [Candidatus Bipolaricaulis sp.]|nr:hypothetical protein [Candidatus Bipolaricaulis sp.]MDD5265460.1 hypothetical protein [Candidatus Bipolaricaulis sp.]MDD5646545.1 hypothetical protein [Candidatus Bipolaricaulis sp.]
MKHARAWSRVLEIVGLAGLLIGAIDPLEGSPIIAVGSGLAALAALLGRTKHRRLLCWSFALVVAGVGAMWVLSALGGIGGSTGRSIWWGLLVLPYAVGWIVGLVGAILTVVELSRRPAPRDGCDGGVHATGGA